MKYSRQRELILNAVLSSSDHPTADDVYARVRAENPRVSLGTVYRNLNLLAENGLLRRVSVPDGSDRFDGTLEEHAHVVCAGCGRVEDLLPGALAPLLGELPRLTDYRILRTELVAVGLCPDCRNGSRPENGGRDS